MTVQVFARHRRVTRPPLALCLAAFLVVFGAGAVRADQADDRFRFPSLADFSFFGSDDEDQADHGGDDEPGMIERVGFGIDHDKKLGFMTFGGRMQVFGGAIPTASGAPKLGFRTGVRFKF